MTQVYPNLENADMEDMNMKQGVQEPPVLMQPQVGTLVNTSRIILNIIKQIVVSFCIKRVFTQPIRWGHHLS